MPIASEELLFEMVTNILLYPGSRGIPTWQSSFAGESAIIKLPEQFQNMFGVRSQLDEDIGEKMALWAVGGAPPKAIAQNPQVAANVANWLGFWDKRGISVERILATLGKASTDIIDKKDLEIFDGFVKQIKAKQATAEQLFASTAPPPDDDEDLSDEEKIDAAARAAAAPTPEEQAALDAAAKNGSTTTAGKGV